MLFIEINDCFENFLILDRDWMLDNLKINKETDMKTINPMNPRRYRPLSGSFANAWTLSIIPDLTIKAPN